MRIVYLTDGYGRHNCGTKQSLLLELRRRGHAVLEQSVHTAGRNAVAGQLLLETIRRHAAEWVFVAHSWVRLAGATLDDVHAAGARVLGMGFSDPYGWSSAKLALFDAYATNHFATFDALAAHSGIPVTVFPTACDVRWHRDLGLQRSGALVYGLGVHPRFDPPDYRLRVARRLLEALPGQVTVRGYEWGDVENQGPIIGDAMRDAVCRAGIVLDLQQPHAPLAHRMFEAMACGTPCITRRRSEVDRLFGCWPGILTYDGGDDLVESVSGLLADEPRRAALGREAADYSRRQHDISIRVDELLRWLEEVGRA